MGQSVQEADSTKKPLQFSFQIGANNLFNTQAEVSQFEKLFPESTLLSNRNLGLESTDATNSASSVYFNLGLHYLLNERAKGFGELRIGLSFQSSTILTNSLSIEQRQRYDTLSSSRGSQPVYIDSLFVESLDMDLILNQIALDLAYVNYWAGDSKFSFYAGLGLIAGLSVTSEVSLNSFSSRGEEYVLNEESLFLSDQDVYNNETETASNGINFFIQPYVPLGLDIRMSKSKPFLEQTHFFLEARPGFSLASTSELGTLFKPALQLGVGFKVYISRD